jgi:hypothetical protein
MGKKIKLSKITDWNKLFYIIAKKLLLARKIRKEELKKFKEWFMKREEVGFCFDYKLIHRAYQISRELQKGLDHFAVLTGREGTGKSTLSMQFASWVNPNFTLKNVIYNTDDFLTILEEKAKKNVEKIEMIEKQSLVMDEGTELLSRETQSLTNKVLIKTFFIQRALGFFVIINVPNFHLLDPVIRYHRTRTLIEVTKKGKYNAWKGKAIKLIAKLGQKDKKVSGISYSRKRFWSGDFNKNLPKKIEEKKYLIIKNDAILKTISGLKDSVIQKRMLKVSKIAKEFGFDKRVIYNQIKEGKLEGKQIGKCWFITKESYDKLKEIK